MIFLKFFACLLLAAFVFSCTQHGSTFEPDIIEPTAEIEGMEICKDGVRCVKVHQDMIKGNIKVFEGAGPSIYSVEFFDRNNNPVKLRAGEHILKFTNGNVACAKVDKPDCVGQWEFCIEGKQCGESCFAAIVMHNGDISYESPELPVLVTK